MKRFWWKKMWIVRSSPKGGFNLLLGHKITKYFMILIIRYIILTQSLNTALCKLFWLWIFSMLKMTKWYFVFSELINKIIIFWIEVKDFYNFWFIPKKLKELLIFEILFLYFNHAYRFLQILFTILVIV